MYQKIISGKQLNILYDPLINFCLWTCMSPLSIFAFAHHTHYYAFCSMFRILFLYSLHSSHNDGPNKSENYEKVA